MLKRVILLFSPYFVNFDKFKSDEEIYFFDSSNIKEKFKKGEGENVTVNELLDFSYIDKKRIFDFFEEKKLKNEENVVLINFPRRGDFDLKDLFDFFSNSNDSDVSFYIFLLNVDENDYEWIENIYNNYFICPICERIFIKSESVDKKNFTCKFNKDHKFTLNFIEKFNNIFFSSSIENNKKIIEKFIEGGNNNIYQIKIDKKKIDNSKESEESEDFFENLNKTLKNLKLN